MNIDAVGKTSLLVAAMRATEHNKTDAEGRLFVDPYAEILAGEEGFTLLERVRTEVGEQPAIPIRTRFFDDKIKQAMESRILQIVILAAGMDARAFRLRFPDDVKLFELDRTEIFEYKQEKLRGTPPRCERKCVSADLREPWAEKLTGAGLNPKKKILWLVEGLLMYLNRANVVELFHSIDALSVSGSIVLFDMLGQSLLSAPYMAKQLKFLETIGAPWVFGEDEPENFVREFGWLPAVIQPGEFMPNRWPHPVAPRNIPNVPRSFLIEAQKP